MPKPEPIDEEFTAGAKWLAKRGVFVARPTPLLALLLGVRGGARPPGYWRVLPGLLGGVFAGLFVVMFLPVLLGVDRQLSEGRVTTMLFALVVLANYLPVRLADRRAAAWLGDRRGDRPRPPRSHALGGWFVASAAITFGGAALLAAAMIVTTSQRAWPLSWLGQLALGAVAVAIIWAGATGRPVLAEDGSSLAVDAAIRFSDARLASPALFALPVLLDLVGENRQPPGFTPWLLGYVVLAVAAEATGRLTRRPGLPAGDYGDPRLSGSTPA